MRFSTHSAVLPLALASFLTGAANAQLFSTYGAGCPGSNGLAPTIGHTNEPVLGQTFSVDLHNARANSFAFLALGTGALPPFDLGLMGMPGCPLLINFDRVLGLAPTDGAGNASWPLQVPPDPQYLGLDAYFQCVALDPVNSFGGVVSNGGRATIGDRTPIQVFGASSPTVSLGGTVTVFAANMDNNPDNTCFRMTWPDGDTALLRVTSVQQGPLGQQATARLASLPGNPQNIGQPAHLAVFHGSGAQQTVAGAIYLSAPGSAWAWEGVDAMGHMVMTNVTLTIPAAPAGNRVYVRYQISAQLPNCVEVQLPLNPCAPTANDYPVGTELLTDIHLNTVCTGSASVHYDFFMETVTVVQGLGSLPGLPRSFLTALHAAQIDAQLQAKYPGVFTVTTDTTNGKIMICTVDPNCTVTGVSGKTIVKC